MQCIAEMQFDVRFPVCHEAAHFLCSIVSEDLSYVMRKTVFALCEQQRRSSACASAQSDQHLCCSLSR